MDEIAHNAFDAFKAGVANLVKRAPKTVFTIYFASMKRRVEKVKQLKGGKTNY